MAQATRSSLSVTIAVWKAMFLREAVSRLAANRTAWVWLLVEPIVHVLFLMTIFTVVRARVIAGADTAMFIMTGLLGFFTARNTAQRCMEAINANTVLISYRQVKPVDAVFVRAALEGFLMLIISLLLLAGAGMFGFPVRPADPLLVLTALAGLWLLGVGLGLMLSSAAELVPELGKILRMMFSPLYFLSGVMYPASIIPPPYRELVFYNPFLHGLEILRGGFFPGYHAAPEASLAYLFGFALVTIFFGLALQVRFADRMVTR